MSSQKAHQILESPEFKQLVSKRWSLAFILTVFEFIIYYGYVILIAVNKPLMASKIGEATTLGIPVGVGVILLSFVLTVMYVLWANRSYDPEVARLKHLVAKGGK